MMASDNQPPLVTLTLCGYDSLPSRLWAFGQMAVAGSELRRVSGLRFWKLLGSGQGGGFSLRPDWSRYGLLAVWETAQAAKEFFANGQLPSGYRQHASEIWTVHLLPTRAQGLWAGVNPFLPPVPDHLVLPQMPIAVLTRASIRLRSLTRFWGHGAATSHALAQSPGLLASVGVGEAPFVRQATFSLWQSEDAMRAFAYGDATHREVIRRTRDENWYAEELFARFTPVYSEGTWNGRDPLAGLLNCSPNTINSGLR